MSIVYRSKRGGLEFDANVAGCQAIGEVHRLLGLPTDEDASAISDGHVQRVPYAARAAECRAWANVLFRALTLIAGMRPGVEFDTVPDATAYLAKWADFLARCGGYRTT